MIVTQTQQTQRAQAIREALYIPLMYLVRENEMPHIKDPIEKEEVKKSMKDCGEAVTLEVRRLLKEMDLQIEPPDLNDPEAINKFIEDLSRRDFRVSCST